MEEETKGGRARFTVPLLWSGQSLSLLVSGASTIALSIWIFRATGNAVDLGAIVAAKAAVTIYASPLAGSVADVMNRKRLIVGSNVGLLFTAAALLLVVGLPESNLALLVAITLVSGLLESMLVVSLSSSVREIAGAGDLTRMNGLVSFLEASPLVAAPLLGAGLFAVGGITFVYALDAASFLVAAVVALLTPQWGTSPASTRLRLHVPFAGAREGLSLIRRSPDFRKLQMAFSVNNLATGLAATGVTTFLLAAGGAPTLGLFNSSGALGLVCGASLVAALGPRLVRFWSVGLGIAVAGIVGRVAIGLGPWSPVWIASAFVRSIGVQMTNAPLTALWQEATPVGDQGKVFGARRLLGQGLYPVAVFGGGLVAEALSSSHRSLGVWLATLGCLEVAVSLFLYRSGVLARITGRRGEASRLEPTLT